MNGSFMGCCCCFCVHISAENTFDDRPGGTHLRQYRKKHFREIISHVFFLFPAVTLQFVSHSFLDYHDPTIEDSYQQQAVIDGEAALLDILDTAGQVEFTAMRDQYMRCGEGFIICYSVTDRHSFQEASEYRKLIARVRLTEDIPLVLVANKLDLQSQRKAKPPLWRKVTVRGQSL